MEPSTIIERISTSFDQYLGGLVAALPGLVAGLAVLLVGYILSKVVRAVLKRTVAQRLDAIAERSGMSTVLEKFGGLRLSTVTLKMIHYLIMLVFVTAAAGTMGLDMVVRGLEAFFAYLPTLLTALAILVIGIWLADKVSAAVRTVMETAGLSAGRSIARVLGGLIVVFAAITAMNVAGIDTALITSNIQIILAGLLLAFGIAYGFAARDLMTNILSSFYGKDRFKTGMRVRIGTDEGVIERIDSISVTLRVADREVLIPTSKLITERIEILDTSGTE